MAYKTKFTCAKYLSCPEPNLTCPGKECAQFLVIDCRTCSYGNDERTRDLRFCREICGGHPEYPMYAPEETLFKSIEEVNKSGE